MPDGTLLSTIEMVRLFILRMEATSRLKKAVASVVWCNRIFRVICHSKRYEHRIATIHILRWYRLPSDLIKNICCLADILRPQSSGKPLVFKPVVSDDDDEEEDEDDEEEDEDDEEDDDDEEDEDDEEDDYD